MKEKVFSHKFYDLVTVGERGQVVIPAQARKDMAIKPGDRLMAVQGIGQGSLVLLNTRKMDKFLSQMIRSIGKMKTIINKS